MIYTAIYFSKKSHIQKRIGVSLPVKLASFVCFETHVPVKSHGRRVLFVDGNAIDPIMMQDVLQQLFAKALAPLKRRRKEHFHAGVFKAHKGNDVDLRIFSND